MKVWMRAENGVEPIVIAWALRPRYVSAIVCRRQMVCLGAVWSVEQRLRRTDEESKCGESGGGDFS